MSDAANTPRTALAGLARLRRLIQDELAGADDGSVFDSGAIAAYNYVLSEWPNEAEAAAPTPDPASLTVTQGGIGRDSAQFAPTPAEPQCDAIGEPTPAEPLTSGSCGCKPYSPCDRHQAESDARLIPEPEWPQGVIAEEYEGE